jgi:hypothetical protein
MTNLCLENREVFGVGQRYPKCGARPPGGGGRLVFWRGRVVCTKNYFKQDMDEHYPQKLALNSPTSGGRSVGKFACGLKAT